MLGDSTIHALTPHTETGRQRVRAHEIDDVFFLQPKLHFDGLKWRSIFPGHLDDAVFIRFKQF